MRKKYWARRAVFTLLVLIVIFAGVLVDRMERNKQKPYERDIKQADAVESVDQQTINNLKENAESSDWRELSGDNVINMEGLKVEMLSCDIVGDNDIETQTTYPKEYFCSGEFPKPDSTIGEADRQSETRYYFIKCRISNGSDSKIEVPLMLYVVYLSKDRDKIWYSDSCCYYDRSRYTAEENRGQNFFDCNLDAGEEQECTLGIEVSDMWGEGETYYLGIPPIIDETYNPDIVPDLVKADSISMDNYDGGAR